MNCENKTSKETKLLRRPYLSKELSPLKLLSVRQDIKPQYGFIKKWVNYSIKYGIGFLTSDNSSGVHFNDNTKIVSDF